MQKNRWSMLRAAVVLAVVAAVVSVKAGQLKSINSWRAKAHCCCTQSFSSLVFARLKQLLAQQQATW